MEVGQKPNTSWMEALWKPDGSWMPDRSQMQVGQKPDGNARKRRDFVFEKGDAVFFEFGKEQIVGYLVNAAQIRRRNDDFPGVKKSEDFVDCGGAEGGRERHPRLGVLREPGVFEESLKVVRTGGQYALVRVENGVALDHDRHVAKMLVLAHGIETGQSARSVIYGLDFLSTILGKSGLKWEGEIT